MSGQISNIKNSSDGTGDDSSLLSSDGNGDLRSGSDARGHVNVCHDVNVRAASTSSSPSRHAGDDHDHDDDGDSHCGNTVDTQSDGSKESLYNGPANMSDVVTTRSRTNDQTETSRPTITITPSKSFWKSCCQVAFKILIYSTTFLVLLFVFAAPLLIKLIPDLPKHLVYLNAVKIPFNANLSDPSSVELHYARNLYLDTSPNVTVGIWHILPQSLHKDNLTAEDYDVGLGSGLPVILYCHGNTGTRGSDHRVSMYKVLVKENYHVVALDYRGYGDSTGSPTSEHGVVHDVLHVYTWLLEKTNGTAHIFLWGHSLGTGISTKAVRLLISDKNIYPSGLVLESPFNNVIDAALHHPFSAPFRMLWWFDDVFLQGMDDSGIHLQSDEHIKHINLPILILHAEDDFVVPFKLGHMLYNASKSRPEHFKPVTFHPFSAERGFQHKWICNAPELPDILRNFTQPIMVQHLENKTTV